MDVSGLAADVLQSLPCLMFDDHGVDDTDDGVSVAFGEGFEGLEAAEQAGAGELAVEGGVAGEQVASVARIPQLCRAGSARRRNCPPGDVLRSPAYVVDSERSPDTEAS